EGTVRQVRLLGQLWAIARIDGRVVAFGDRCPHRGAPLSEGAVVGGAIQCRYHGWSFAENGACVRVPALGPGAALPPRAAALVPHGVDERYGIVWLAPETPIAAIVELPEWGSAEFPLVQGGATIWRAGAGQMVDNFLDVAHFPFTHLGSFGVADDQVVPDHDVRRDGWTIDVTHAHLAVSADPDDPRPEKREQAFHLRAPFTIVLRLRYVRSGDEIAVLFAIQPVDSTTSRLYRWNLRNAAAAGRRPDEEHDRLDALVVEEDRSLLERFESKTLPLDLRAEMHTRADRATVELRRMLTDLCIAQTTLGVVR
ncbi:MAG: Rieske (2Fe-2S) iron-sulfur domain protein, partial [Actinomycetia bacterium]|nr:Rieske (2Fe-2S) iron-sulfur domain protein [Actinomycetes bacterium]